MSLKRKQYFCPKCGLDKGFLITKKIKGISPQERPCKTCRNKHVALLAKGRIAWNRGLPLKEETKLKLRECNLGKPSPTKGKILSLETKIKLSCFNRGITIDQFDAFTTPLSDADRVKIKKSNLIKDCLNQANYTCAVCKIRGSKLNAHHMDSFSKFPHLRFELTNLICLCVECHRMFHSLYGNRNNTKFQFEDFLNKFKEVKNVK